MEIVPRIHMVPGIRWSRVYLIEDETLTLVDSGLPWDVRRIFSYVRSIGRDPDELDTIIMTHSHPDHAGGALAIKRRTRAKIVAHANDTRRHAGRGVSLSYMGVFTSLRLPLPFLEYTPVSELATDGQVLPMLGGIRVIHTPGHTPGSLCFFLEQRGILFSGDTLFSDGRRLSRSVPYPGSNGVHYRRSLETLTRLEFDTLCGGHGVPLIGGATGELRRLLADRPEPPSWGQFLTSIPKRLFNRKSLQGEHY